MKRVIFIGGTSYSGSTYLDMVLSNAPDIFSCGELAALFRPYRQHHFDPVCGCGDDSCQLWTALRQGGEMRVYSSLFKQFPTVSTIVDSSKNPIWIAKMSKQLCRDGVDVRNLLIWKSPLEFSRSRIKRGRSAGWQKSWRNYHRLYFRLIPTWQSIKYNNLVNDPFSLPRLCEHLGLTYSNSRNQYWQKTHHTLFGNASAKVHLYPAGTVNYLRQKADLEQHVCSAGLETDNNHDVDSGAPVSPEVANGSAGHVPRALEEIVRVLEKRDLGAQSPGVSLPSPSNEIARMRATALEEASRRLQWLVQRTASRVTYWWRVHHRS
jgi:hypothetical protein